MVAVVKRMEVRQCVSVVGRDRGRNGRIIMTHLCTKIYGLGMFGFHA